MSGDGFKPTRAPGMPDRARTFAHEKALVAAILADLKDRPHCYARKTHGSQYQQAGEPDVDGCLRGRALKIEAKMPGEVPRANQYASMNRWQRAGALAGWVTSLVELDDLLTHADDPDWMNPQLDDQPGSRVG